MLGAIKHMGEKVEQWKAEREDEEKVAKDVSVTVDMESVSRLRSVSEGAVPACVLCTCTRPA